MAVSDAVISVELAGRDVIMRVPSAISGVRVPDGLVLGRPTAARCCRPRTRSCVRPRRRNPAAGRARDPVLSRPSSPPPAASGGAAVRLTETARARWTATLTWKAAVFITVMCCALAALLGVLVHVSVTEQTVSEARDRALARLADATGRTRPGTGSRRTPVIDPAGLPDVAARRWRWAGSAARWSPSPRRAPHDVGGGPGRRRRALAVEIDYAQSAHTIDGLDRAIVWSSVLAIGATLLVGAFAVTRVTRRLHRPPGWPAGSARATWTPGSTTPVRQDPCAPAGRGGRRRRRARHMASTLQRKLLSEQRFTADVAHELRTPLTGLHAAAELLPPGRPTELVRDRVRALRALTEDLLEISRLDAGRERRRSTAEPTRRRSPNGWCARPGRRPRSAWWERSRHAACGSRRTGGGWNGCSAIWSPTRTSTAVRRWC